MNILYRVPAINRLGSAAAFKNGFGLEYPDFTVCV